ncbi:hypothetical protein ACLOJK_040688, partial [Asimina triloba]
RWCTIVEHLWCSTFFVWRWLPWRTPELHLVAGEAAAPSPQAAVDRPSLPPSPPRRARCATTVDGNERCPRRCHRRPSKTHHCRAVAAPIRAIHHDGDDEHIPDPSKPQDDVDHSGHTRRVFLARHQQIQLYLAPIVAHFKSTPYHRLIWIFMAHSTDLDPRMDQRQGNTDRFLLRPIRPSIFAAARCLQPRLHRLPSTARDCHHTADAHLQSLPMPRRLPAVRPHPPARLHRRLPALPPSRLRR